jgi:hypothetical protein
MWSKPKHNEESTKENIVKPTRQSLDYTKQKVTQEVSQHFVEQ